MTNISTYLVQSGISLILLYGIYILLLQRDTFYRINRYYLMASLLASVIFPLVNVRIDAINQAEYIALLEPVIITPDRIAHSVENKMGISQILIGIYLAGVLFFLSRFFIRFLKTVFLAVKFGVQQYNGINLVVLDNNYTPFSFFNLVFINKETLNHNGFEEILLHERVHVRQNHSIDLILLELMIIIQWFNPIVFLYQRTLISLHEYLADEGVLKEGYDKRDYQKLLLNQTLGVQFISMSNNFNQSLIKRRFIMMSKSKTKSIALLKLILVVPVALIFTLVFTFSISENVIAQTEIDNSSEVEVAVQVEKATIPNQQDAPIFTVVEKMPEYPGGKEAMIKYLSTNIKYPEEARKNGVSGKVYVTFIIEKNGKVNDVRVLRGVSEELDKEAVSVISQMPDWNPGMQKGQAVRVQYNLPIQFHLDTDKDPGKGEKENKEPYKDVKKIQQEKEK